MSHDVFVSHSSKDKPTADALVAALEQQGVTCWIAPRDIPAGATWGAAIIAGIETSRVMVLIFSSRSDASPQVLREVERAVAKGVTIVPVRIEDVAMSKDLEYFLSARHWLDALEQPLTPHLSRVVAAVRGILQAPAADASQRGSVRPAAGRSRRLPGRWAVSGAAGLIAVAALLLAWRPWDRHRAAAPPTAIAGTTAPAVIPPATKPEAPAVLPARYLVTDLGTLGGEESESAANAVNDAGQAVGDTDVAGPFVDGHPPHHAFLWSGGKMADLGTLGGPNSLATAINSRSQIVGRSDTATSGEPHAFLYESGRMRDLGTLGGKTSEAYGINAAGDVVGKTDTGETGEDGPVEHAFLYHAGKMKDLGAWNRRSSQACAINDSGRITGVVFDRQPYFTPFIYNDGQWVGLGSFAGTGHAQAIDGAGDVVGSAQSPEDGGEFHAFIYRDGRRYDLGTLGGKISYGYGIDSSGRALGGSRVASADDTRLHAFVADAAGLHDLNRMVPADARCVVTAARSANSAGVIVGEADFATGRHAVVLTPDTGGR
jgi:probable HAF family extracellular repeat protein